MNKQKLKQVFLITILVSFIFYVRWGKHSEQTLNVTVKRFFIVAVRGNDMPLYGAVDMKDNENPSIYVNEESKNISQMFINKVVPIKNLALKEKHFLNLHIWNEICNSDLESILYHPLFPKLPTYRRQLDELNIVIEKQSGIRIFGYLVPEQSAHYTFLLDLQKTVGQIWISEDNKVKRSKLLFHKISLVNDILSESLYLEKNKSYFIDIVLKTGTYEGKFSLKWVYKNKKHSTIITKKYLNPFVHHEYGSEAVDIFYNPFEQLMPMLQKKVNFSKLYDAEETNKRLNSVKLPFMPQEDANGIFQECDYNPSYIVENKIKRLYQGVWETHLSSIYPNDQTNISYVLQSKKVQVVFGNPLLEKTLAEKIAVEIFRAIQKKNGNKYVFSSIINVELNKDMEKGDRYLVELELLDKTSVPVRYSEYVYIAKDSHQICYPKNFKWNKTADVNVILTCANQGRWVKYFIDTMVRIYKETNDINFNVIIVDFDSKDIDLVKALKQSALPRYMLLKHSGKFHKTIAIQTATNTMLNPGAIALQVDLHTTMPSDFIELARKHTILERMAWSPMLVRLQCGSTPQLPYGSWEISGYGIFSIFKSDWIKFGGMDIEKFKNKWGGEDWDLLDRVLNAGYEVERLKVKNFYHVFHSKKGMWQNIKTRK